MKPNRAITHEFVEFIPRELDEGTLYISMEFATASHRCFCGCGTEVVTPISPAGWRLTYDGENVTLYPSIGSWSLPCKSHYWIRDGEVEWSYAMSRTEIAAVRRSDALAVQRHYGAPTPPADMPPRIHAERVPATAEKPGIVARLLAFFAGK